MSIDSMMVLLGVPNHRREEFAQIFNSQTTEQMSAVAQAQLARIIWNVMRGIE